MEKKKQSEKRGKRGKKKQETRKEKGNRQEKKTETEEKYRRKRDPSHGNVGAPLPDTSNKEDVVQDADKRIHRPVFSWTVVPA